MLSFYWQCSQQGSHNYAVDLVLSKTESNAMKNLRFPLARVSTRLVASVAMLLTPLAFSPAHAATGHITAFSATDRLDGTIKLEYTYDASWESVGTKARFTIDYIYNPATNSMFTVFSQENTSSTGSVSGYTIDTFGGPPTAPKGYKSRLLIFDYSNNNVFLDISRSDTAKP